MSNLKISDNLLNLVFSAVEEGIWALQQAALVPFAFVMRKEGVSLQRFPADSNAESLKKAAAELAKSDEEVLGYALVYDALIEVEGEDKDALMIEAAERTESEGYRFAQRYQAATLLRPPYTIGELAYLGACENYLN